MSQSRKTNKDKKLPPSKSKLTQPSFNDPDIDFDLDLAQFSYKPQSKDKKQQTPSKTSAQRSILSFVNPEKIVDLNKIDIAEQLEIERKLKEKKQNQQNTQQEIKQEKVVQQQQVKVQQQQVVEKQEKKPNYYGNQKAPPAPLGKATQQEPTEKKKKVVQKFGDGPLNGRTIVLTGNFSICSRDKLEEVLKQNGAKVTTSVSGKTDYLLCGGILEDGREVTQGMKFKKATEMKKAKIIRQDDLDDWLKQHLNQGLADLFGDQFGILSKKPQSQDLQVLVKKGESFADRYKPMDFSDFVGNQGCVQNMLSWLSNFYNPKAKQEAAQQKKKFVQMQMNRFQSAGDAYSRACIISGPPGIGKSTMVRLIAQLQNIQIIQTNASEQRNKNSVRKILYDLVDNNAFFFLGNRPSTQKFMIVMDEVDGMTGSDRGGISALIESIKMTRIPIVCICNDIENQKLKSLLNYCYPIKFSTPSKRSIAERLRYICSKENINYSLEELEQMAECFNGDIRQSINFLEFMKLQKTHLKPKLFQKDQVSVLTTFHAAQTLLNEEKRKPLKIKQLLDLFYTDYQMIPLIIQDCYLNANSKSIKDVAKAANLIAESDILSKQVYQKQQWQLMQGFGFMSSIYPAQLVGYAMEFPRFPQWLGKNSSQRKIHRERLFIKGKLASHLMLTRDISDEASLLMKLLTSHLNLKFTRDEKNAVSCAMDILERYGITSDQMKVELADICFNPGKEDFFAKIEVNVKSLLTRNYNKRHFEAKEKRKKIQITDNDREVEDNYNPKVGEEAPLEEPDNIQPVQQQEEESNQIGSKKKGRQTKGRNKNGTKKQTKKGTKKQSQKLVDDDSEPEASDSQGSLADFIAADDSD